MLALAILLLPTTPGIGRRALLHAGIVGASVSPSAALAATVPPLEFASADGGLRWAELKQGAGAPFRPGQRVSIDYIMTRRGGAKIHSTVEAGEPFSWTLGDGSVIAGLEQAVGGGGGVPPMLAGGARRVIVPMTLGYGSQTTMASDRLWQTDVRELGPVPPPFVWLDKNNERVDSYLRFKNLFQNPNAFNQPDLVLDIRLRASPED
eukprot:scaffold17124_cov112-Isochrysis_galbana.AAC.2